MMMETRCHLSDESHQVTGVVGVQLFEVIVCLLEEVHAHAKGTAQYGKQKQQKKLVSGRMVTE